MKKKPYMVAIIGTHGTGKSTLAFKLAARFKQEGKNVKVIQEVARDCPFPINVPCLETCLWIYHTHSLRELEASRNHDVVICDRSALDSFIYARHFGLEVPENLEASAKFKLEHCYDEVICMVPDMPLKTDGVRSPSLKFQEDIHALFLKTISSSKNLKPVYMLTSSVFNNTYKDSDLCQTRCF